MTIFQFIVSGSTGVAVGKKQNMKNGIRNTKAIMLIAMPARPSDQRAGGRGSLRKRLESMQPMESM